MVEKFKIREPILIVIMDTFRSLYSTSTDLYVLLVLPQTVEYSKESTCVVNSSQYLLTDALQYNINLKLTQLEYLTFHVTAVVLWCLPRVYAW
jgi:hypothetical protein